MAAAIRHSDGPTRRLLTAIISAIRQLSEQHPNDMSTEDEIEWIAISGKQWLFRGNQALSFLSRYIFQALVTHDHVIFGQFSHLNSVQNM